MPRHGRLSRVGAAFLIVAAVLSAPLAVAAEPEPAPKATAQRVFGPDRYATAAEIVNLLYAPGSRPARVYVTTGENYPDALAAGPAAADAQSPLLLVQRDAIPAVTEQTIAGLDPLQIEVIGGPAAVSPAVVEALGRYAPVFVSAGIDRYDTAAIVALDRSSLNEYAVWVASGVSFPDALIAGGAAAYTDDPMILVPPGGALPPSVVAYLDAVRPQNIILVGSVNEVGPSIETELRAYASEGLTRVGNASVYERSAAVFFPNGYGYTTFPYGPVLAPDVGDVTLVTAAAFPDGLGGATWAAFPPASPMYLSDPTCVPIPVAAEIGRLNPITVTLIGGPAALGPGVEAGQVC